MSKLQRRTRKDFSEPIGHLKASKCTVPFPIQRGHRDSEDAQKAICHVLDSSRLPVRGPRHSPPNRNLRKIICVFQDRYIYAGNVGQLTADDLLASHKIPRGIIKVDIIRGNQLLKSPSMREPSTASQAPPTSLFCGVQVSEVCKADGGLSVV